MSETLVRGEYLSCNEQQKRTISAELLYGEKRKDFEHMEPYGYTSQPLPGAEVIALCFDGDRSHMIASCISDKRFRPKVKQGEVCIFDDLGRKVFISRDGIIIEGVASNITINTTATINIKASQDVNVTCNTSNIKAQAVNVDAPITSCTGNLAVKGSITANDGTCVMQGGNFNVNGTIKANVDVVGGGTSLHSHVHREQGDGANTSTPL